VASDKDQLDFVLEQMARAGRITARAMFGEYGIYCEGKIVALFCDNQLFVKPTEAGKSFIGEPSLAPPYPGAKPYFLIEDRIDDRDWLAELIRLTARELPSPAKKPPKKTRK
jgi:TfoX/Sxy family transcriptional regulator of competence genes